MGRPALVEEAPRLRAKVAAQLLAASPGACVRVSDVFDVTVGHDGPAEAIALVHVFEDRGPGCRPVDSHYAEMVREPRTVGAHRWLWACACGKHVADLFSTRSGTRLRCRSCSHLVHRSRAVGWHTARALGDRYDRVMARMPRTHSPTKRLQLLQTASEITAEQLALWRRIARRKVAVVEAVVGITRAGRVVAAGIPTATRLARTEARLGQEQRRPRKRQPAPSC